MGAEKKPSLASLMPDKTKGIAAQKRAVKRIVASASKRTLAKKETTKLHITNKPFTNAKITARTRATRVSTKAIKKKLHNLEPVIVLPTMASIRAKEKSLVILQALLHDFHLPAQQVALASGICFVAFGSYMALAFSGALPSSITPQAAQVLNSNGITQQSSVEQDTPARVTIPTFKLLEPIPEVLAGSTEYTISVTGAKTVSILLFSQTTGERQDVMVDQPIEGTYRFTIETTNLVPGEYVLKTIITSAQDSSSYSFRVGEFEVKGRSAVAGTFASSTLDAETDKTPVGEGAIEFEPALAQEQITSLRIETLGNQFSGRTVLKAYAPTDTRFVEFYTRPIASTNLRFLGLAEKRADYWQFFFDSTNVPNGKYELIARTRKNNDFLEAASEIITISNYASVPAVVPFEESSREIASPQASADAVASESDNRRSFSKYSLFDIDNTSSTSEQSEDIDFLLEGYRDELQTLLERYAVAQQSGDPLLVEIATSQLHSTKSRLVADVLADSNLSIFGDDVDTALSTRFEELQKRIETFEKLRRVASNESSSADIDADGISDFDELNLYGTNHEKPDSDNDGVTDGIEIMRGFNPLEATAEAIIVYELPQETIGLVENELLKIESVSPFIKTENSTLAPIVQASIRGKGLPNSYVTIYVFSTPTIVTVRTDQEGSFEYTFEKELEDGEHEVYLAVTDNAGAIMARSNPFKFVKEAQAFTHIDGVAASAQSTDLPLYDFYTLDSYNIAIGLGVLSLGIILLILGNGLKERHSVKTVKSTESIAAAR